MRLGKNAVWEDPVSPLTGSLRFYWTVLVKPVRLGFPEISYRRESMPAGDMFRKPRRLTQNPMAPTAAYMTPSSGVFGGGAPSRPGVFGGQAPDSRRSLPLSDYVSPEQAYSMQQSNPFTSTRGPSMGRPVFRGQSLNNPIAPAAADAQANAMFSQRFPGVASSSLGASERAAGMTANNAFQSGMSNRYVGQNPMRPEFDEVAARQRAAYEMAGGPASDPTNLQSRMRGFGGGGKPWYEREAEAARQQRDADRVAAVQAANDPSQYTDRNYKGPFLTAEGAMGGRLEGLKSLPDSNPMKAGMISAEEDIRDAAAQVYQDRLAKFKSEHGGMNARQVGIQQRQQRRMDNRFRRDVRAGMNPMSAQAMALYPDQAKQAREAYQNPMKKDSGMSGPQFDRSANTVESRAAAGARVQDAESSPTFQQIGADPSQGFSSVNQGLRSHAGTNGAVSPQMLTDIHKYALDQVAQDPTKNPFFGTTGGSGTADDELDTFLWTELSRIPEGDTEAVKDWYNRYSSNEWRDLIKNGASQHRANYLKRVFPERYQK